LQGDISSKRFGKMLKRFLKYYRSHLGLFSLDISSAIGASLLALAVPALTRKLLDDYVTNKQFDMVIKSLAIMLAIVIARTVLSYIRVKWGHILGVRMESDMRADLFGHLQKLSFNYFDRVKTGHIMSRISNDLNTISEVAHHAPEDLLISTSVITGAFIIMFMNNWQLAIITMLPLPGMLAWGILYGGSMRRGFRRVRKKIADMNSSVENSVQGIREVKSYANENEEILKFADVNCSFKTAKEDMYGIMGAYFAGMQFFIQSYFLVVIGGGTFLIYYDKDFSPTDLIMFILYVYFILNPIQRLVNFTEQFQQGAASFERFIEIMDIEPDIVDSKDATTYESVQGDIKIKDLSFKYQTSAELVLENININIPAHKTIAIVGESGAGKSTIASLIPRFYEIETGSITIDGHDIKNLKQRFLRQNVGLVQQNVFLFDSTIRDNIMYGNPQATEAQLIDAAEKANIYEFIQSLPDGFDSMVGERGVMLSGGQKQRISIARVFLKNPPILIFDEATSSLDTESESLIQKSLELLSQNRTTVIIAHRLSTVRNADYLYVLKKGNLVEQGTHQELIDKGQYYHSLYSMNLL
jgi:ATP-binding cassette subfamily B protein